MFSVEFWFDSGVNTTQYGGFSDEKILDLGPTVWAQRPFLTIWNMVSQSKMGRSARCCPVLLDNFQDKLAIF